MDNINNQLINSTTLNSNSICKEIIQDIVNQFYLKENYKDTNQNNHNNYNALLIKPYLIHNKFELLTIKNFTQQTPSLCGYHALFNFKNYIRFIKTGNDYYIKRMNSCVKY